MSGLGLSQVLDNMVVITSVIWRSVYLSSLFVLFSLLLQYLSLSVLFCCHTVNKDYYYIIVKCVQFWHWYSVGYCLMPPLSTPIFATPAVRPLLLCHRVDLDNNLLLELTNCHLILNISRPNGCSEYLQHAVECSHCIRNIVYKRYICHDQYTTLFSLYCTVLYWAVAFLYSKYNITFHYQSRHYHMYQKFTMKARTCNQYHTENRRYIIQ